MSIPVLRTADAWWVRTSDGFARRVQTSATTTAELLADLPAVRAARDRALTSDDVDAATLELLSPVTAPCRVVAQMTNYASHVVDSGMNPERVPLTFFRKASGSITGPDGKVNPPAHVRLLDYEIEIGVVFGQQIPVNTQVTEATLPDLVAGLVIANDLSARDVQLPKSQFYEAKSYPGFTPLGPILLLLEPGDWARFADLRLTTRVNGEIRQDAVIDGDMIYPPLRAVQELTRFQHLDVGDVMLTGTPGGTALTAPPKPVEMIGALLPPHIKWKMFFRGQGRNPKYLREGDVMELAAATADGALDLGIQRTTVGPAGSTAADGGNVPRV